MPRHKPVVEIDNGPIAGPNVRLSRKFDVKRRCEDVWTLYYSFPARLNVGMNCKGEGASTGAVCLLRIRNMKSFYLPK